MVVLDSTETDTRNSLALDRASVRTKDQNGYLHVAVANISKANICPYLGSEIPDYERLGLGPTRLYQLFRDPKELEAAAATFNGVPILNRHIPVMAEKPPKEAIVGTTGTNAVFKSPYLTNSLTIWDASAIAGIESEDQRELSCGYRYDADMTPGSFSGTKYDGVMRNLRANHVALVPDGRAGADVVVGDQKLPIFIKESTDMAKVILSRKALGAKYALATHLAPKLAQDAKLDFNVILKGVTAKNFTAQKPEIFTRIKAAAMSQLAQDANLDDVVALLDKLDNQDPATADDVAPPGLVADPDVAEDAPDFEAVKAAFKDKLKPEDHAKLCEMLGGAPMAGDEPPPFPGKPEVGGKKADDKEPEKVTKQAMDSAISKAVTDATTAATNATIGRLNAVREAERDVRPFIGELAIAQDSAEGVYRLALDANKIEHKGITELAALKGMVAMLPKPGAPKITPRLAQDAAGASDFDTMYPNAKRIRAV